ncbi:GDP-mannose 4,6-dehydratase [Candidatus Daviesbacteria bacterium]|nr:GDP-mannose 4,6-dehydratase [Candidatus Daviesbacteria bacterium]
MNKVLITGGAGFIGSNLALSLLKQNWQVVIFDNLSRKGSKQNLEWVKKINPNRKNLKIQINDIRDVQTIDKAVKNAEVIFHLAAQVAVTTSFLNPREDFEINLGGTFNILEAARKSQHKPTIVFASTNKVYGNLENLKVKKVKNRYLFEDKKVISETYPLDFHSPYGCSNGAADQYVRDYFRMYQIPTVVFRQSCIYGPRQMGVEDQGWTAHFAIASILGKPITIFGEGKQVRDLLHVDDLIEAYLKSITLINKTRGEVFNIGGGEKHSFSLLEYIQFLEKLLNKKIKFKLAPVRPGDQKIYISDNTKLKKILDWQPKTCHKDGLKSLAIWVKDNRDIFRSLS